MTCSRAQEFLAQEKIEVLEQADAKKQRFDREAALALVREASALVVAKGKRVVRVAVTRTTPSDDELAELVLGPSGNLRAPALRHGSTLVIGFEPSAYEELRAR